MILPVFLFSMTFIFESLTIKGGLEIGSLEVNWNYSMICGRQSNGFFFLELGLDEKVFFLILN